MKAANALGAKTARACDSCLRRRARWFCGADDAFLCHGCDNLVHSANQLASRHERVRLQTASSKSATSTAPHQAWHSGFTRKARTPRHNNKHLFSQQQQQRSKHEQEEEEEEEEVVFNSYLLPVVPELGSEDAGMDETEEQLLCRVPEFDPFEAELCDMYGEIRDERLDAAVVKKDDEETCDLDNFPEFLGSDMDLAEFAADVESLLESGLVGESGAQLFDCKQEDGELMEEYVGVEGQTSMVKIKDEEEVVEAVNNNNSSSTGVQLEALNWKSETTHSSSKGKIFLRLNYEDVISAWASQGCPWTTGNPPQLSSDDCWSDCLGWSGGDADQWCYGEVGRSRGQLGSGGGDRGREARVTRYREKRRTRLFAKKIRYEVRKLNAEKRPRMKGRFVKRASFVGTSTALPPAASR